jgi:hypothetical protein
VKEERNIVHTIKRRKANWIGHILRTNCLIKHVTEGKIEGSIEVTGRRGRRRKQLLDDLEETRGYWKLKEEAQDRTLWRTRFGRGCGSVGKTDCGMNIFCGMQIMKLLFYVQFFQPTVTSSLLGPNIFPSTLFSKTLSLRPSLNSRNQVSHPYKTTGEITVLYILTFIF